MSFGLVSWGAQNDESVTYGVKSIVTDIPLGNAGGMTDSEAPLLREFLEESGRVRSAVTLASRSPFVIMFRRHVFLSFSGSHLALCELSCSGGFGVHRPVVRCLCVSVCTRRECRLAPCLAGCGRRCRCCRCHLPCKPCSSSLVCVGRQRPRWRKWFSKRSTRWQGAL